MTPLAKRRCGPCRACCVELKIDVPELRKAAHLVCPHHTGTGCGIYATRPKVCQEFLCGWRLQAELDDSWRPDLGGVLVILLGQDRTPKAYHAAGHGMQMVITGGEAAVRRPAFVRYVSMLVTRGAAVYLSASSAASLVNEHLEREQAKDLARTEEVLLRLFKLATAARWRRGVRGFFEMIPHLYRLQLERARAVMAKKSNISGR